MAVKLRLKRMGSKKRPFYRIVAADARSPRDGRFIEILGTYNPLLETDKVTLKEERIVAWLKDGAQPTDTVKSILSSSGLWAKFKAEKVKKAPKKVKVEVKAEEKKPVKKAAPKTATKKPAAKKTTTTKTKKSEK